MRKGISQILKQSNRKRKKNKETVTNVQTKIYNQK